MWQKLHSILRSTGKLRFSEWLPHRSTCSGQSIYMCVCRLARFRPQSGRLHSRCLLAIRDTRLHVIKLSFTTRYKHGELWWRVLEPHQPLYLQILCKFLRFKKMANMNAILEICTLRQIFIKLLGFQLFWHKEAQVIMLHCNGRKGNPIETNVCIE